MRRWQVDLGYFVALGLLVFFAVAPYFGMKAVPDPFVVTGCGALIGWVFTHTERERKERRDGAKAEDDAR